MKTKTTYILSIDQGTTSSRAILFNHKGNIMFEKSREIKQYYPNIGWVEQSPEEIWKSVLYVVKNVVNSAKLDKIEISAIGITNQRETTLIWDKNTGLPIYNAIVWQDSRTAEFCKILNEKGLQNFVRKKTGLLIDPYFSASKILWILDNIKGARKKALNGDLCFGTIDTFLLWRLTKGKKHYTDVTNASRTCLYNIKNNLWDEELCKIFMVPKEILPEVKENNTEFGITDKKIFGQSLPILGMIGDQQSALIGQGNINPGSIKSTFGTGCFMIVNSGNKIIKSKNKLLSTIAYKLDGKISYGLEGSIFIAGAAINWLKDELKVLKSVNEIENLIKKTKNNQNVYFVPALTGLGAPYWSPNAQGAIYGITRETGPENFIRAALESVAYQTNDLINAMISDGIKINEVKVDGGMSNNNWLMQFTSNILNKPILRPVVQETTALGVAMITLLALERFNNIEDINDAWKLDRKFIPHIDNIDRTTLINNWNLAVKKTLLQANKKN